MLVKSCLRSGMGCQRTVSVRLMLATSPFMIAARLPTCAGSGHAPRQSSSSGLKPCPGMRGSDGATWPSPSTSSGMCVAVLSACSHAPEPSGMARSEQATMAGQVVKVEQTARCVVAGAGWATLLVVEMRPPTAPSHSRVLRSSSSVSSRCLLPGRSIIASASGRQWNVSVTGIRSPPSLTWSPSSIVISVSGPMVSASAPRRVSRNDFLLCRLKSVIVYVGGSAVAAC